MKNQCRLCAKIILVAGLIGSAYLAYQLGSTLDIGGSHIRYTRDMALTFAIFLTGAVSSYLSYVVFAALAEILENQELLKQPPTPVKTAGAAPAADHPVSPVSQPPSQSPAASAPDSDQRPIIMRGAIVCPKCGTAQDIKNKICINRNCQADLKVEVPYYCGRCGHQGPYSGVCPKCGSSSKVMNI